MSDDTNLTPELKPPPKATATSTRSLDDYEVKHALFMPLFSHPPAIKAKWDDFGEYHKQLRAFLAQSNNTPLPDVRLLVGHADRPDLQALGPARRLSVEIDPRDGTPLVGMRFADSTKGDLRETRVFDGPVAFVLLCLWLPGSGGGLNPRKKLGDGPLYGYHSWGDTKAYWRRLIANADVNTREVDPIRGAAFPFEFRSHLIRDFGPRRPISSTDSQTRASWIGRSKATAAAAARFGSRYRLPWAEMDFRQVLSDGFLGIDNLWAELERHDATV